MSFVFTGLPLADYQPLFGLSDAELAQQGAIRYVSDDPVGYACRITLADAAPGESVLLLNYEHLPVDTPYRSRHAIFVSESATQTARLVDEVPAFLKVRPTISLRAYDAGHMMLEAAVVPGAELAALIARMLDNPQVDYLHAHHAGRGCFAARIDRG